MIRRLCLSLLILAVAAGGASAQQAPATDANTPLHLLAPDYPVPYGAPAPDKVVEVLQRVRAYLEASTPDRIVDRKTGQPLAGLGAAGAEPAFGAGAFRLVSYEWGVVYSGMLLAAEATGDPAFRDYAARRLATVAALADHYRARPAPGNPVRSVLEPRALDDAGSMCAATIKALRAGVAGNLRPMIDRYIAFIEREEFRLADGTLARNRPQPSTLWLDDLYMSVPALAQMGKLTSERKYFDEAVKQVLQFSQRMFVKDKGLYRLTTHNGLIAMPVSEKALAMPTTIEPRQIKTQMTAKTATSLGIEGPRLNANKPNMSPAMPPMICMPPAGLLGLMYLRDISVNKLLPRRMFAGQLTITGVCEGCHIQNGTGCVMI